MRTNVAIPNPAPRTHEGAVAARIGPVDQLRRSCLANLLWEDNFYEDGVSIADRIQQEIAEVLKMENGADTVANIAYEARTAMKLRHVPLLLLTSLIKANREDTRKIVAGAIAHVVQRPDEMGELVSLFWKANGKRCMLPNQMKKGLALALDKFDEFALAKWDQNSAAVKLRDVLFLSHARPKDAVGHRDKQARREYETEIGEAMEGVGIANDDLTPRERLYRDIAHQTLKTPDTWEVALSGGADKKETFTRLLEQGKLGALALLRNLRNMQQAGVSDELIREGLGKMKTERVLPFRFITAARYAPRLEDALESGMFRCLEGSPRLNGKTVLVVDNSGSMDGKLSAKSEMTRAEAARALAMLLREVCQQVEIVVYSDFPVVIAPRRGFALRDAISAATPMNGTYTQRALIEAAKLRYDRVILITDEQSHEAISHPGIGARGYCINVGTDKNGIGYGPWMHVDGFSEAILDFIAKYEESW